MGIYGVLGIAMSGIRASQASIEVVGRNVANADTPGYTRKTREPTLLVNGDMVTGLRLGDVQRQLNTLVQKQYRIEASGAGYANTMSRFYKHIDTLFGEPGSAIGLDTIYNQFQHSLEELTVSPESFTARDQFLRDAQAMAQNINQMARDIQGMRLEAEQQIGGAVQQVNELLQQIASINQQIATSRQINSPPADLLDKRDAYINELSSYIDIKVMERERGMVSVFTQSGALLLDLKPSVLQFDERGTVTPEAAYSFDDAERGVGTIRLETAEGLVIDLIQDNSIRSGEIAALLDLRDTLLPQAQAQLDALADSLARTLSSEAAGVDDIEQAGMAGFEIDMAGMQSGDRFQVVFTDGTGTSHKVTMIAVDDASSLPLGNNATADPNDTVIGFDMSGGMAAAAAALADAYPDLNVTGAGDTLRVLDGAGGAAVSQTGGAWDPDGTGIDLSSLSGETLTVAVGGVDHVIDIGAGDIESGDQLLAALDAIPGLSAAIVDGELRVEGDPAGTAFTLDFSDDQIGAIAGLVRGNYNASTVQSLAGAVTATDAQGGGLGIPLFIDGGDGGVPYTDNFDGNRQQVGFAGRIKVNPALLADNSLLIKHAADTASGDPARPVEMLRRLTQVTSTYSGSLGMGTATPYEGTVSGFVSRVISHQGAMAADVERSRQAQDMVVTQLEERFTAESGVNIDLEMGRLIELQTAYTANTRVISAVREMMDLILHI